MERVLAKSLETFELDEFGRWPGFFKALRDSAIEQRQEQQQLEPEPHLQQLKTEPEQTNTPPEMLGMKWCWTGPLPESYEDEPLEEVEQARPPPQCAGPPSPLVSDWPWPRPVFVDLTGDNDNE